MRLPTVGCYVELSVLPTVDSVPLHSPKARRIINRSSYF